MKNRYSLRWLIPPIVVLAIVSAGMGLFYQTAGRPYPLTTFRGENVLINGRGLYFYDTVSSAAQMQGNDLITLLVGMPLLVLSTVMAGVYSSRSKTSMRGQLLLTGTLGFVLYTYMSMSMLTAYNRLFLVYVALFVLALYAFIVSMLSFNLAELPNHFKPRLPYGLIAGILFSVGGFLVVAWVGRVLSELMHPELPAALENTTTRVIQAMDLALVAPLAILAAILLLRRSHWGYLLASIAITKGLTMALAVSTMAVNMALRGVPDSIGIMIPFIVLTVLMLVAASALLRNIQESPDS